MTIQGKAGTFGQVLRAVANKSFLSSRGYLYSHGEQIVRKRNPVEFREILQMNGVDVANAIRHDLVRFYCGNERVRTVEDADWCRMIP